MTKENQLKEIENQLQTIGAKQEAIERAHYLVVKSLKNARDVVEKVPNNLYIEDWKREAEHLEKVKTNLDSIYTDLTNEQSRLCAKYEAIEQGKEEAETLTLKLDPISAQIVANTLEYYNLTQLEEAEKRDPFKDNGYLIKAIKSVLKAYEEATSEGAR